MFKVFRTRWKRASRKQLPVASNKNEPHDVSSSHGSDFFPNYDFDVEYRIGGLHDEDTNNAEIDTRSLLRSVESPSIQVSEQPFATPKQTPGKQESSIPLSDTDLFIIFQESAWLDAKRQLYRLQKNGTRDDIRRILTQRNNQDESILHIAAWKAPPRLFHFMVNIIQEPDRVECLSLLDKDGNTPFHLLCANLSVDCVDFSIVKDTLMLETGVLDNPNSYGDTPLHLLVASDALSMTQTVAVDDEAAVEEIVATVLAKVGSDRLLLCKNAKGLTLLHVAIANQVREGVLNQLLRLVPSCSKDADERGSVPLHYVAASPLLPASVVEKLITAYPESIHVQDKNGDTPLHLQIVNACRNATVDENMARVTELLLGGLEKVATQTSPGSSGSSTSHRYGENVSSPILIQNNDGLTPLHACSIFWTPTKLTQIIVESPFAEKAALLKTRAGATPLHLACESDHVHEIVDTICFLSLTRRACAATDNEGRIPLVVAVQNSKVSADVIKTLCRAYPEGLTTPDRSGRIALHYAISRGPKAKVAIVKELLKAAPVTINITWKGNTPLTEACKCRVPASVIKVLVSKKSDANDVKKLKRKKAVVATCPKN